MMAMRQRGNRAVRHCGNVAAAGCRRRRPLANEYISIKTTKVSHRMSRKMCKIAHKLRHATKCGMTNAQGHVSPPLATPNTTLCVHKWTR